MSVPPPVPTRPPPSLPKRPPPIATLKELKGEANVTVGAPKLCREAKPLPSPPEFNGQYSHFPPSTSSLSLSSENSPTLNEFHLPPPIPSRVSKPVLTNSGKVETTAIEPLPKPSPLATSHRIIQPPTPPVEIENQQKSITPAISHKPNNSFATSTDTLKTSKKPQPPKRGLPAIPSSIAPTPLDAIPSPANKSPSIPTSIPPAISSDANKSSSIQTSIPPAIPSDVNKSPLIQTSIPFDAIPSPANKSPSIQTSIPPVISSDAIPKPAKRPPSIPTTIAPIPLEAILSPANKSPSIPSSIPPVIPSDANTSPAKKFPSIPTTIAPTPLEAIPSPASPPTSIPLAIPSDAIPSPANKSPSIPTSIPPAIPSDANATASTPKVGLFSASEKPSASLRMSTDSSSSSAPPVKRPPPIPPREVIPIPMDAENEEEEEDEEEDMDLPELPQIPAKDESLGKEPETALYIPKHAAIQQGTIFIKSIVDFEALSKKISSNPTDLKSVVFIQAHLKGWFTRLRYSGVSKKKIEVFKGLLKDQRNISRKLKLVSQYYLRPFKTKRFKGIQKGELDRISSEINFMVELHSELLEFLVNIEKIRAPFYDNVGSIVSILTKNFQQVGSYIENIRVCKARLEACERSSPDFAALINETYCNLGEESLYEILDMPVDQSKVYYDTLICLQESTPPRCPDYEHLTESISQMQLIVNFSNNCIFKARNKQLCLEFENKIGGFSKVFPNLPERVFIVELIVFIIEKKKKKKSVLTAFSDCIVLSKEKKTNQYAVSEVIPSTSFNGFSVNKNESPKLYTIALGNNKSLVFIMNDAMQEKSIPILSRHIDRCSKVKLNPFGSSLGEIASANASKDGVPELIVNIFMFLIKYVDIPGIFQVSSKPDELQVVRRIVEADPKYQFSAASDDCHAVANILKMFLRELNPGLFPQIKYSEVIDLDDIESDEKFVEAARELLDSLPLENKATLAYIFSFFISFTKRSKNRVKLTSIGVILGPSLVRPEIESVQTAQQIPKANSVIAKLAEHSDELGLVIQLPY